LPFSCVEEAEAVVVVVEVEVEAELEEVAVVVFWSSLVGAEAAAPAAPVGSHRAVLESDRRCVVRADVEENSSERRPPPRRCSCGSSPAR
jgi:hypothetical protein